MTSSLKTTTLRNDFRFIDSPDSDNSADGFAVVPICLHPLPFNILLLTLLHRRNYCIYVSNIEQKWVHYLKEQWRNNDVISSVDKQQSAE